MTHVPLVTDSEWSDLGALLVIIRNRPIDRMLAVQEAAMVITEAADFPGRELVLEKTSCVLEILQHFAAIQKASMDAEIWEIKK